MENEIKTCRNCRYMRQHYAIGLSGYFVKLSNVFDCRHVKVTKTQFKKIARADIGCQYWDEIERQEEENELRLEEKLKWITKELEKVIEVLEKKDNA